MSGQLAKPVTPHWLDAQIGQEACLRLGLSKRGESGLSSYLLEARTTALSAFLLETPRDGQELQLAD